MHAVVFIGIPGSGKSSFYKETFFTTHVRISLDLVKTRYREKRLLDVCLETDQRFVVDNTNPTRAERAAYIAPARAARVRYTIHGYIFESQVEECLRRNATRPEAQRVPDVAILSAAKKLELPSMDEGFDALKYVQMVDGGFRVLDWQ